MYRVRWGVGRKGFRVDSEVRLEFGNGVLGAGHLGSQVELLGAGCCFFSRMKGRRASGVWEDLGF